MNKSSEEIFLKELHKLVVDSQFKTENMYDIGTSIGLNKNETFNLVLILKDAGFLKINDHSGGIRITSLGILNARKLQ